MTPKSASVTVFAKSVDLEGHAPAVEAADADVGHVAEAGHLAVSGDGRAREEADHERRDVGGRRAVQAGAATRPLLRRLWSATSSGRSRKYV